MIKINPQKDKISISRRGVLGGFDGHSLRSSAYFKDEMADITKLLEKAEHASKFWVDAEGNFHCE